MGRTYVAASECQGLRKILTGWGLAKGCGWLREIASDFSGPLARGEVRNRVATAWGHARLELCCCLWKFYKTQFVAGRLFKADDLD